MKPIPKIKQLVNSDARYLIAWGGRGSGKSYGFGDVIGLWGLDEPGIRILCTRDIQNTLSDSALAIVKRTIKDRKIHEYFKETKHGLSCVNGTEYIFRGLQNPSNIKSLERIKYCWVEEAQRVSQDAWDILIPTIREPGSRFLISFNPDAETDPVYKNYILTKRPNIKAIKINYNDNPYFPDVLRHEMEWDKAHNYDKYMWIWEGNTRKISERQVFRGKYRVGAFETPDDALFYYGADWGFANDPTVFVRMFIRYNILWIDHEAYGIGIDIDDTPTLFDSVPGGKDNLCTADSARPETISYLRQHGYPKIRGAHKGKGSVEDGIEFMKSFDGVVIHDRCKHTADDFGLYSYKEDKLTNEPLPVLEDRNNNCIDAIRYALEQIMMMHGSVANLSMNELGM